MLTGFYAPENAPPQQQPQQHDLPQPPVIEENERATQQSIEISPEFFSTPQAPMLVEPPPPPPTAPDSKPYTPLITYSNIDTPANKNDAPVDLTADNMAYDEGSSIVNASGDVFLQQSGRILRADNVNYDVNNDLAVASGNVVLNDKTGDVHLADRVIYQSELRDGQVENLHTTLNDGSRFTAKTGEESGGVKTTMQDATYTPCEPCANDPDGTPTWQLRASEVTHDKEEARVTYKNARLEAWGVPVLYTPYFSHPDGTITQKSGFLSPKGGYKSGLGAFVESNYYWALDPDQDMTLGAMVMSEQNPLGLLEYRKRWNRANFNIEGGITSSDRKDRTSGQVVNENDELRGHVFADALWDMNDKWRSGVDINWSSDDQYMRQYDFTDDDVLTSEIYTERFSGRNYASARLMKFQDIRIREDRAQDQPDVLPEIVASFKGEPGAVPLLKGRWSIDTSMLGLQREGNEQDMNRFSMDLVWKRRFVSDYGLVTSMKAKARGDFYHINDNASAAPNSGKSTSGTDVRTFPQAHIESSYPMARSFENTQMTLEPVLALTAAPKVDIGDNDIPNEDSGDVQIDASNLFESNRFSGLDRIEDQSRATYGLRTGLYGYDGSYGNVFLGQSYRLDDKSNPFPYGSGLENQGSDIVGQVSGRYKDMYTLDYRYQLDNRHLRSRRHEVDFSTNWNRTYLSGRYLYAKGLEGTEIDRSREQFTGDAGFYFSPEWRIRSGATHDFGENKGLRRVYGGIDYLGQCLFLSLTGEKNYTTEVSGEGGTEIVFRIGLKNLGDFEESGYKKNR